MDEDATPRVRTGGFPMTPGTIASRVRRDARSPAREPPRQIRPTRPPLPPAPERNAPSIPPERQPLIPLTIIDAPSQRFYFAAIYCCLHGWRLYDWLGLVEEDASSWYLFAKWILTDVLLFFVALPTLRIPWLDLPQPALLSLYFIHFCMNWILMFNVDVPLLSWLLAFVKLFYDRELSISEHNVKVANILHNSSLIMGKQIINILPEGAALLNPQKTPYCLGPAQKEILVPLYFNATVPVEVELVRIDLETSSEEVIKFGKSQIREIGKLAKKHEEDDSKTFYTYNVPVKKVGAYRLNKVLDEYKLQVERVTEPTYVVPCPKAQVRHAASSTRCINDLSNLSLEVHGTPPLKIQYSRTINGKDHSFHFQSLQPDGFSSPLVGSLRSNSLISGVGEDVSWARAQTVTVGLNESMSPAGEWQYSIDEVQDVFGNVISYVQPADEIEPKPKPKHLVQNFAVRERPHATLVGCDLRNPLKVAKGQSTKLPVKFGLPGQTPDGASHTVTWQFSPIDTLSKSGDHGDVIEMGSFTAKHADDQPTISAPGLYTLKSISCESCEGEIEEPSSCLLLNPLEPRLMVQAEEIPDKCAGNSIGLRVNLDLIGTPPFNIRYDVMSDAERTRSERVEVNGLRQQIELLPRNAGHYKYRFRQLKDAIYTVELPQTDEYFLEQHVKPSASAYFDNPSDSVSACLDEPIKADIQLRGDGPFTLEWELVHDGRKKSEKATNIMADTCTIETAPLAQGGEYTIALTSVTDKSGCKMFLKEEMKISVRRQRPRAAFGQIEKKRSTRVVEDATVNIPLRLSGAGPWRVFYRNLNDTDGGDQTRVARTSNDFIEVNQRGTYEIIDVMDNQCHGQVDPHASLFDVHWFPRPELSLVSDDSITQRDDIFVKQDVCEGDIDGFEVALRGSAPYHISYKVQVQPGNSKRVSNAVAKRDVDIAMPKASIPGDTSKAGVVTYTFFELSDNLYNHDARKFQPIVLEQTVNAKPSASFVKPGQTFKFCMSEQENEEKIPIVLEGMAPFSVEIEMRHHTHSMPETYRIPNIPSNKYGIQIPRRYLKLGSQQVRIRRVRDARGCQQKSEGAGPSVTVQMFDAPAIYPLETRTDYCVGERIAYTLSGTPPFEVHYEFGGSQMKAKSTTTNFRRIAESAGDFVIQSVSDKASDCRASVNLAKSIHSMPSVRISRGKVIQVDIHEGSEVEILFEFWGTPPFEFTYTRSTNARKGQKSTVLETKHDVSYEHTKIITASLEGTYEVVAIKDKFCAFSTLTGDNKNGQKMLTY